MNTLRTILLGALGLLLLVPAARAQDVSQRWLDGDDVDEVYAGLDAPARELRVQLWHENANDDRAYRRGESIEMSFRTNGDSYVVVYRIDVDGYVEVLWPTSRYDDGFVYGNHSYVLPRPGSPVGLQVGERKGVEYVQAIASEVPFDLRGLAIDFRFDVAEPTGYDYVIAGDPFLAVNDVNFAITGLEEDVDYVVTDWAHLYVDSKVDYARYTCAQCHDGSGTDVAHSYRVDPYDDTCTTINVYSDWGWQRRWYVNFGWYPLYYEPAYYYWDPFYGRTYWFSYYPVYYSWPVYPVYTRPYYWYGWHDSPWYRGDFRVRYKKDVVKTHRLYDFDLPNQRTRVTRGLDDVARGEPTSLARVRDRTVSGLDRADLVRDRAPSRERREIEPRASSVRTDRETAGLRPDRVVRGERRLTSLESERTPRPDRVGVDGNRSGTVRPRGEADSNNRTERRWTRPVIRNESSDRSTTDRGRSVERERTQPRRDPERANVERDRQPTRRDPDRGNVDRSRDSRREPERERVEPRRTGPERQRVEPQRSAPERQRVEPQRSAPQRERVEPQRSAPQRQRVEPQRTPPQRVEPQRSAPARRSEPSRGGGGGGGSSRSRTNNGGGGRG